MAIPTVLLGNVPGSGMLLSGNGSGRSDKCLKAVNVNASLLMMLRLVGFREYGCVGTFAENQSPVSTAVSRPAAIARTVSTHKRWVKRR